MWSHKFKKLGTLTKSRKETYIEEEKSRENGSVVDMCPTEKSLQMELLKLIFPQLPAINDSEYLILCHINNANISLKSDIRIITKSVLSFKSDLNFPFVVKCNCTVAKNNNCLQLQIENYQITFNLLERLQMMKYHYTKLQFHLQHLNFTFHHGNAEVRKSPVVVTC